MRFSRWCLASLAALCLASNPDSALGQAPSPADPAAMSQLAAAHNRFGFKLLKQLGGGQAGQQNLFLSPASIVWAFDMVLNGAGGATYQAISQALETGNLSLEQINQANAALKNSLEAADPKVELAVANSLWGKEGVGFLPAFLEAAKKFYAATLSTLKSAAQVNSWVSEKTRGKITEILRNEDIKPDTILILVNALYFKGLWSKPFDKAQTLDRDFQFPAGTKKTPMMHQTGSYRYAETPAYQAMQLPYGAGRLRLTLVLPAKNTSLGAWMQGLDAKAWGDLRQAMESRPGRIALPKFKVEYGVELLKPLAALGMAPAFGGQAEFGKIADLGAGQRLYISDVRHKTFVELNEEGTEAAAVTSIGMRATGMPPPPKPPFEMVVDRPFFIAIEDQQTGLILFMGAVAEPKI
ncbi:MAG TPA: serpin family protein [bacterium]|nr:serpin family protein [bacterium]